MSRRRVLAVATAAAVIIAAAGEQAGRTGAAAPTAAACRSVLTRVASYRGPRCLPDRRMSLVADGRRHAPQWIGRMASTRFAGWAQQQSRPGALAVVRGPRTGRHHVTEFRVRPGDTPVPSGERAELAATPEATGAFEGAEAWYAWSTYFPDDLNPAPASTFNVFTQFHQFHRTKDRCPPNVALQVNTRASPPRIRLAVRGGSVNRTSCIAQTIWSADTVALRRNRWYDFVFHVRWSADLAVGFVELFVDGRAVVPRTAMATLYRGQTAYAKQGLYRAPGTATSRILHAGLVRFG